MPKYRKPNEEEIALLSQVAGVTADSYIVDDETGQAMPADTLPGNAFTAGAAGVGRGARDLVAGAVSFPGRIADAVREGPWPGSEDRRPGPPMPEFLKRFVGERVVPENPDWKPLADEDRSIFTKAGEGIREIGQEGILAPDPAASVLPKRAMAEKVGQAIGSILPLVIPQLAAMRAGAAPAAIGALNTGSIAGATMAAGDDVATRALAQQEAEGKEPDRMDAVNRGLEYAPAAFLANKLMGALGPLSETGIPTRLAELITKTGAAKALGFGARETLKGGIGEGVDTAMQQQLAGAPVDVAEIGESALLGGLGQGAVATGAAVTSGAKAKPAEVGPTAEELAAGGQAEQAKAAEVQAEGDKARQLRNAARLDSQRRGTPYQPLNPSPVDEVFADIQKKRIPVDEEILNKLEDTYANNPANVPKLQEVARVLTDELMLSRPDKLVPETERVAKVQEELGKIDAQLDAVQKRVDSITDGIEKRAEKMTKSPPSKAAGAEWLAFARERAETERGELKILADQMRALLDQRKLLTQNAAPTVEGGPQPIGEPMQNQVLTAEQAEAQKASRLLTAPEAQAQNLEALRKQGETQSQAEAAKLAGAEDPVTKALQGYAEGEQGLPFSGEGNETATYGTLVPPSLVESFTKVVKDNGLKLLDPVRMVHAVTQAESDRMVQKGPVGTHVVSKFDPLYIDREKITNRKRGEWKALYEKHKVVLDTPEFQKWRNEAHTKQQRDLTKLPPHMHEAANALDAYLKSFHAEQKAEGIKTIERRNDGRHIYRDPIDVEGYGVFDIDNDVYRAMEEGGDKWAKYRQDWLDHWVQQKGSLDGAEEALNSFRGSFAKTRLTGGEPLFSAIRNQIGTSLPESWRSKNIHDSMLNYIDNWAMDVSWARNVQKDPIMRRAFGITRDPAGNDTTVADANYKPTKEQWDQILTRARKADAGWLKTFKPGDAMDMPILADSEFGRKFRANYTQTPLSQSAGGRIAEAANQVASSIMMMHTSKLRNIMQSGITVLDYAMSPDIVPVMSALIDTIVDPKAAIARTEKAGAMSMDVMRQEAASAVQTGLYKGLRTFREWTGLNAMDKYAKAIAYNVARAAIEHQAKTQGRNAPLLREFGQIDAPANTPMSELIDQAAAVVANHVDPQYDIRSVPATMIPQDRGFVGNMMRLMTWSVARFNHWYNDAYIPAVTGGDKTRLFKSIFVGAIGAVATQELLAWLQSKMPRDLSFNEWLNLDNKKQQDEFAPMLFGYLQAQGNMGVLGDIAYATARKATGKSVNQDYSRPMIPAFLVGSDLYNTVTDFGSYVMQERGGVENTDITDWMMLGVELAKTAQTLRAVVGRGDSWLPERLQEDAKTAEDRRERRVFEETTGRSALTGEKRDPMSIEGQAAALKPNKFSLQKEFNVREGADFEKLGPSLARRALQGWSPKTQASEMNDLYYEDIARRRGSSVAAKYRARNEQKESDRPYKRQVARELGQIAAEARRD